MDNSHWYLLRRYAWDDSKERIVDRREKVEENFDRICWGERRRMIDWLLRYCT